MTKSVIKTLNVELKSMLLIEHNLLCCENTINIRSYYLLALNDSIIILCGS